MLRRNIDIEAVIRRSAALLRHVNDAGFRLTNSVAVLRHDAGIFFQEES
jgi:hypothetical protein